MYNVNNIAPVVKWISCLPSKQLLGVRIPPGAQIEKFLSFIKFIALSKLRILDKTVDNYVSNVYKGHSLELLSFRSILLKICCKIRIF